MIDGKRKMIDNLRPDLKAKVWEVYLLIRQSINPISADIVLNLIEVCLMDEATRQMQDQISTIEKLVKRARNN